MLKLDPLTRAVEMKRDCFEVGSSIRLNLIKIQNTTLVLANHVYENLCENRFSGSRRNSKPEVGQSVVISLEQWTIIMSTIMPTAESE